MKSLRENLLKKFFDPSPPILKPVDLVLIFTKKQPEELALPGRAIIVFDQGDLKRLLNKRKHKLIDAWTNFRWIYEIDDSNTIVTKSYFGGPNVAALIEELSVFGVKEFVLWGYCGGIGEAVNLGDIIIAQGALREDGVSHHYLDNKESIPPSAPCDKEGVEGFSGCDFVYTDWFDRWEKEAVDVGILKGLIWSCDALYRETRDKIEKYRKLGISAVEMEVASFYAVCSYRQLKCVAFLVVSDLLKHGRWTPGFHTKPFDNGVRKMAEFMLERIIA